MHPDRVRGPGDGTLRVFSNTEMSLNRERRER